MTITILAIGKKSEAWVAPGIARYEKRLRKPFNIEWKFVSHSSREGEAARREESLKLLDRLSSRDAVVLLDERGRALDSPMLTKHLLERLEGGRKLVLVVGGAYGVTDAVRERADLVWSLSPLVFPHQLVRLIVTEQVYRAQEIAAGRGYHHA